MSGTSLVMQSLQNQELARLAISAGLDIHSMQSIPNLAADQQRLQQWQEKGHAADMRFMQYPPHVYTDLQMLLPSAKSVVSFAIAYPREQAQPVEAGYGKVARYAWEEDYHQVLPIRMEAFVKNVEQYLGRKIQYRILVDAAPLLERAVASQAKLGFVGKNTLLIRKKFGSFFFLAELLWNLECLQPVEQSEQGSCGSCQKCQQACPTQALQPYELNANRCISYLTIEKKGPFTAWERQAIGEWIFGCDICQEVCPFNGVPIRNRISKPKYPFGPVLSLEEIFHIRSQREFLERFHGSAITRARKSGLMRNALAVAANTKAVFLLPHIWELLERETSATVLSEIPHALLSLSAGVGQAEFDSCIRRLQRQRIDAYATTDLSQVRVW